MNAKSFLSLGLRDPGFLQSSASWTPDPADPDLQAWWKASDLINTAVGVIGDKTDATVNKTSALAPNFNLFLYSSAAAVLPTGTTVANYIQASQDITDPIWLSADVTRDSATKFTFGAQNARILQYYYIMLPSETWKATVTAKRISGNTNVEILHQDSATGTATPITLTGSFADYSATFAGPATANQLVRVGLRDPNAGGHGQVEVSQWHLRRTEHSDTYIHHPYTQQYRMGGTRGGVPAFSTPTNKSSGGGTGSFLYNTVGRTNNMPFTVYMSVWRHDDSFTGAMAMADDPATNSFLIKTDVAGAPVGRLASYANAAPFAWQYSAAPNVLPVRTWGVLCFINNGASSSQRYNLNAPTAVTHPAGSPNANGWYFGSDTATGAKCPTDFHEIILAYSAHDLATQELYIRYMASQIGITV